MDEAQLKALQTEKYWRHQFTDPISYSGVLLIDMQDEFLRKFRDQSVVDDLVSAQSEVLDYCRENSFKVFVLEYLNFGETDQRIRKKLDGVDHRTVVKSSNDGFWRTDLLEVLSLSKISHIYAMGVNMDYCVLTTIESALLNGFEVSTAKTVISQPKYGRTGVLRIPNFRWFENNTNLYEDHKNLDEILK